MIRIEAEQIITKVGDQQLLDEISFVASPGSIVGIVGGNGAGKSTLLKAMTGAQRATSGRVLFNHEDYAHHEHAWGNSIGYVPQNKQVAHENLTVMEALTYVARLRCKPHLSPDLIQKRIEKLLNDLELQGERNKFVSALCGGERTRLHICMEQVAGPPILFLDEPAEGLDARTVKVLSRCLNEWKGRQTIVLIAHDQELIDQCDRLIYLGKKSTSEGFLAYDGPRDMMLNYFRQRLPDQNIVNIANIHQHLTYISDEKAREFSEQACVRAPVETTEAMTIRTSSLDPPPYAGMQEQIAILTQRYWSVMRADVRHFLSLLLAPVIMACLFLVLFPANTFDPQQQPLNRELLPLCNMPMLLLMLLVSATALGMLTAAKEFTKESLIFKHEARFVRPTAYFLSKALVLAVVTALQVGLLLGVVSWRIDFHIELLGWLELLCSLLIAAIDGVLAGLCISAIAGKTDHAYTMTGLALMANIFFTGAINITRTSQSSSIDRFFPSHWAYGAMAYAIGARSQFEHLNITYPSNLPALDLHEAWCACALLGAAYMIAGIVALRASSRKTQSAMN
jgi:ABC transport system ATP-binding/permease protein